MTLPERLRQSGSALLLILGAVALLTILVISFFASARTEYSTSSFYSKGVNTKLLSENVINLVMAQLREGARSTDINNPATAVAWASQPGMIRTYDNTGAPYKYFKLYSWDNMIGAGAFDPTQPAENPPTGWSTQPNVFTDLNEPVFSIYPIIDPSAANADGTQGSVEGFSFTPQSDTNSTDKLSMPVKWLYVLKNGSLSVGTPTAGTTVSITGATANNPVIGRVAFWSDDETSKVNINTASEGIFWDRPVGAGFAEEGNASSSPAVAPFGYGTSFPSSGEFQRTPGHPATTSLSAVFGFGPNPVLPVTGLENASLHWPLTATSTGTYATNFGPYFSLTPRLQAGGSMGGAQLAPLVFNNPGYRLYDSVDELAFDPSRLALDVGSLTTNANLYLTGNGAVPAGRGKVALTPQIVEQRRFFLTAHSRAPEETLFGTPRISLWPLQDPTQTPVGRTAKDNLLAFCSTIGSQPYYFQRASWYQYQALDNGPITSNPAICSSQSATLDFPNPPNSTPQTGVARNENLYAYLQAMTSASIPGFGGNFLAKYPGGINGHGDVTSDRDEILTEMFDLIRSGVNTYNISTGILPHYTFTPWLANAAAQEYGQPAGAGSAVPIAIATNGSSTPNTHGLGRTYNIAEVTLVFMPAGFDLNDGQHGIPLTQAGSPDPTSPSVFTPGHPRRLSIGYGAINAQTGLPSYGLPWACEIDNPNFGSPARLLTSSSPAQFLYWDRAATAPSYGTYVYQAGPPAELVVSDPATGLPMLDANNHQIPLPTTAVTIADPQTTAVQAFVLVRFYDVLDGPPAAAPHIRVRITGLDQLKISFGSANNYVPMLFNSGGNAVMIHNIIATAVTTTSGGLTDFIQQGNIPANIIPNVYGPNDGSTEANLSYPFVSQPIGIPASTSTSQDFPAYPSPFGGEDPYPPYTTQAAEVTAPPGPRQVHNLVTALGGYAGNTMSINGAQLQIDVLDGVTSPIANASVIQSLQVTIPAMHSLPVPTVEMATNDSAENCGYGWVAPTYGAAGNAIGGPRIPGFGGDKQGAPPGTPMPLTLPGVGYVNSDYGPAPATYTPSTRGYNGNTMDARSWKYLITPLDYYSQLPYDVTSIAARLSSSGDGGRMILEGDTVRSLEVTPAGKVAGDMRLLAANPIQTNNVYRGDAGNIFVPLGSQRPMGGNNGNNYGAFPTQGPWDNNPFIKQLHTLFCDVNNGRTGMNLVQTSQAILTANTTGGPNPIGVLPNVGGWGAGMGETSGYLFVDPSSGIPEHYQSTCSPVVTPELMGAYMDSSQQIPGDWTTGVGDDGDGPFIDKPDEGAEGGQNGSGYSSYFQTDMVDLAFENTNVSFSPNRQVPSGIIFGTLPSRVIQGAPWCTLLFCPNPAANDNGSTTTNIHYGFGTVSAANLGGTNDPAYFSPPYSLPPDHLFLDLFWMPVVEPYAISEPFSTSGKVNMNYEIVPFGSYIHRSTALHAVMKSTRILAIPTVANDADGTGWSGYIPPTATAPSGGTWPCVKTVGNHSNPNIPNSYTYRYGINLPATIDDFKTTAFIPNPTNANAFYNRFIVQKDIFRSASEICDAFLVPQVVPGSTYYPTTPALAAGLPGDASYSSMQAWWAKFELTGDNSRESPYNQIYPRLTTKSNTFDVHMRVQVLSQTPTDRANGTFNTATGDSIVGEYRGSVIVERYLDPNQTGLPDFATTFPGNPTGTTSTVDSYVRYRIVSTHAFAP